MARIRRVLHGQRVTVFLLYATGGLFVALVADGYFDSACYNGALGTSPLQCYAFQQAERDDLIDIDAMYDDGDGMLYIFAEYLVSATEGRGAWNEMLGPRFVGYARDYAIDNPEQGPFSRGEGYDCTEQSVARFDSFEDCVAFAAFPGVIDAISSPINSPYHRIYMLEGDREARKRFGGWATWNQIWPSSSRNEGSTTAGRNTRSGEAGEFDISDVDVTNIPDLSRSLCGYAMHPDSCDQANRTPDIQIAGSHRFKGTLYIHIKAPEGFEPGSDAARQELLRLYPRYSPTRRTGEPVAREVVATKYSYAELMRYALILDQFARSSGNTIGITFAVTDINRPLNQIYVKSMYLVPGLEDVNYFDLDSDYGRQIRDFVDIHSGHDDLERIADALPTLLRQLGIPEDAVGRIVYWKP